MLFVLIFAISFLANTISVEVFQSLNLLVQSTAFSFGNFFHIQYKTNVKKKLKRKAKWETEIDLQETKTERKTSRKNSETFKRNRVSGFLIVCEYTR